jgi:hypothetical protein
LWNYEKAKDSGIFPEKAGRKLQDTQDMNAGTITTGIGKAGNAIKPDVRLLVVQFGRGLVSVGT